MTIIKKKVDRKRKTYKVNTTDFMLMERYIWEDFYYGFEKYRLPEKKLTLRQKIIEKRRRFNLQFTIDKIKLFRNLETVFKRLRKEDINYLPRTSSNNIYIIARNNDLKKKFISFLKYSILTSKNSTKAAVLFSNKRLKIFRAGKFKGGFRFFRTSVLSPKNRVMVVSILLGFLYFLFVIVKHFCCHMAERAAYTNKHVKIYLELFDIEEFYFFFTKNFKDYFLKNDLVQCLQLGYTMDVYQDFYLIDIYNIQCLFEWEGLYLKLNYNEMLTKQGDAIRPKVKVLGDKSPFKKRLILYWLTNPDFRPRWTLNHFELDFGEYTGLFFDIYCIFEYLYEEYLYQFVLFNGTSCFNYLFNTFKADFFDKHRLYTLDFYDYKKEIVKLKEYKKCLLKNFYFRIVSHKSIVKKAKKILKNQREIIYTKSIYKQMDSFGSFIRLVPLNLTTIIKYIYCLKKYAKQYLYIIEQRKQKIIKCIIPYRYRDLLRLFNKFIPLHKFKILLPYTFFILYTFYCLYYRRLCYTYYIRNESWLHEYTSFKQYYTLVNHPAGCSGRNINKLLYWKYWRIWSLQKFRLSKKKFTNYFGLYSLTYTKRDYYLDYDYSSIEFNLNVFDQIFDVESYLSIMTRDDFYLFRYKILLDYQYLLNYRGMSAKWKFFMQFKSVYKFSFADLDYGPNIEEFINIMYVRLDDQFLYWNNLNFKLLYQNFIQLYLDEIQSSYFLQDLYTFNSSAICTKSLKLSFFYLNIIYSIIYATNPKYFWQFYFACWPQNKDSFFDFIFEVSFYLFFFAMENIKNVSKILQYIIIKLRWRWNIGYYYMYYNYEYFLANNIVNLIKKSRLKALWLQMCYFFNENKIDIGHLNIYSKYTEFFADIFFILLFENYEYLLLFFFLEVEDLYLFYYETNNLFFKNFQFYWNTTLSYRYVNYNSACTFEYFQDWFLKRDLFDLWIYANYDMHEGRYCYRESLDASV